MQLQSLISAYGFFNVVIVVEAKLHTLSFHIFYSCDLDGHVNDITTWTRQCKWAFPLNLVHFPPHKPQINSNPEKRITLKLQHKLTFPSVRAHYARLQTGGGGVLYNSTGVTTQVTSTKRHPKCLLRQIFSQVFCVLTTWIVLHHNIYRSISVSP